ncbi:MAG: hypothetical protein M1829_005101 [Trizodia sp. TS-e1964]|nr:MAG: hypothetical protein M1829_005101 [Trizodia sp. TS-e1964]
MEPSSGICTGTYSNVPVYELYVNGHYVMRRRSDDWINATHILKVADYDKPQRTRILEREVQKNVHEKVQGGYGKYQGTWVPLADGRELAEKSGVLEVLRPIFDYVPGDQSPPQAQKHITAATARTKIMRASARKQKPTPTPTPVSASQALEDVVEASSPQYLEDTPSDILTGSVIEDELDTIQPNSIQMPQPQASETKSIAQIRHDDWANKLLDHLLTKSGHETQPSTYPAPPAYIDLDKPVDDEGHTALHWAASSADLVVVFDLLSRGANIAIASHSYGETALIRSVLFTNNYERETMPKLFHWLASTVEATDHFGANVFHHVAALCRIKSRLDGALYYFEVMLTKLRETLNSQDIARILDTQDRQGDTPLMIVARYGARKCARCLIGYGASMDITNKKGDTIVQYLVSLNDQLKERKRTLQRSSSPPADPFELPQNGNGNVEPHRSKAARMAIANIGPGIGDKLQKMANEFDRELLDQDRTLEEAQRILAETKAMLEKTRNAANAFAEKEKHQPPLQEVQKQVQELETEYSSVINRLRNRISNSAAMQAELTIVPQPLDPEELQKRLDIAMQLVVEQKKAEDSTMEVTRSKALADIGPGQEQYQRLLSKCLGVPAEEVDASLDSMLQQLLEDQKMDDAEA